MDGDEPGREAAGVIAGELLAYPLFVRVIRLPDGAEPDTMPETELRALVQRPR
jgi:DNA primase